MLIDILDDLLYTVFKPNFECFRKVRYFAKFLWKRTPPGVLLWYFVCGRLDLIGTTQFFLILFSLCRSSGHEKAQAFACAFSPRIILVFALVSQRYVHPVCREAHT